MVLTWLAITIVKASTARIAPSGSTRIPSQRRMLPTAREGLTALSIGMITVGPVTVMIAPNRMASVQSMPMNQWAMQVTATQIITTPQLIRRPTIAP